MTFDNRSMSKKNTAGNEGEVDKSDDEGWFITLMYAISVIGLSFLMYIPSIVGKFVYDDHVAIVKNKDVTSANVTWSQIFSHDFWGNDIASKSSHKSYRPLTILSYRMLIWLDSGRLRPEVFHVANLVLHALVCLFVSATATHLFGNNIIPYAGILAYLFSVHPIHAEAVASIVGQAELWSAFFSLVGLYSYMQASQDTSQLSSFFFTINAIVLCAIAMLFKEQGITMLGFLLIYNEIPFTYRKIFGIAWRLIKQRFDYVIGFVSGYLPEIRAIMPNAPDVERRISMLIARSFMILVGLGVSLYARWCVMGDLPVFTVDENPTPYEKSLFMRFVNYSNIYVENVKLLLYPFGMCVDWSMGCIPPITRDAVFRDHRFYLVVIFWMTFVVFVWQSFFSDRTYSRYVTYGFCLMVVTFLPASNIFYPVGFVIAERVLYMPAYGYLLLVVAGIRQLLIKLDEKWAWLIFVLICITMLSYMSKTYTRCFEWQNDRILFESGLRVCPSNPKIYYNLGKLAQENDLQLEAMKYYQTAIKLNPDYTFALNNLANIYRKQRKYKKARETLLRALKNDPTLHTAWMNLGIVHHRLQEYTLSKNAYLYALKFKSNYPACYYNLGLLYKSMNKTEDAIEMWRKACKLDPKFLQPWLNMAATYDEINKPLELLELTPLVFPLIEKPKRADVQFAAHFHMFAGNAMSKLSMNNEANMEYYEAATLAPCDAHVKFNMAVFFQKMEVNCYAGRFYNETLELAKLSKKRNTDSWRRMERSARKGLRLLEKKLDNVNCVYPKEDIDCHLLMKNFMKEVPRDTKSMKVKVVDSPFNSARTVKSVQVDFAM